MRKFIIIFLMAVMSFSLQGCYFGRQNYFEEGWIGEDKDTEDFDLIKNYFEKNKQSDFSNSKSGVLEGKNYINILVESTDFKFFDPILTPTLWKIYNQSTVFENYYAVEFQQGATCNSEFMSMTGLYPFGGDSFSQNICDTYSENTFSYALPNQLKQAGYETYYFHSGFEDFYNRKTLIPGYGFETVKFQDNLLREKDIQIDYLYDSESINFFEQYVDFDFHKNNNKLFFINYLSYSGHGKYEKSIGEEQRSVVDKFLNERFGEKQALKIDDTIKVYYEKIYEFELLVQQLVNLLIEKGVYYDTVITLQRDHQPYMLNINVYNDYLEDYLGYKDSTKIDSYDILKNPFMIYVPSEGDNQNDLNPDNNLVIEKRSMTTVDIAPTMLNLLGVKRDYTYFAGNDVYTNDRNFVFIPNSSEYKNKHLITDGVYFFDQDGLHNLYAPNGEIIQKDISLFESKLERKFLDQNFIVKILSTDFFKMLEESKQ